MISVIGGSGFIGTRLCKRLQKSGVKFEIIDKRVSKTFPDMTKVVDVRDIEGLRKNVSKADVLINLAAEHRDDVRPKRLYDEVNVDGARNVCQIAEEKGVDKIIFTSSVAVYGFAPRGTDESGELTPFNDYGRTKVLAENVYKKWQAKDSENRTLVIVRPTVVFGEQNRGNVYNLLKQIASGKFIMVGNGQNVKSMAYVENIAAFIEYSLNFGYGVHLYNYIDKPDFDMNTLVGTVYKALGKKSKINFRIPYWVGYSIGRMFDIVSLIIGKSFPISAIRIKKFCSDSMFDTSIAETGFKPPVSLQDGLRRTIEYEFINKKEGEVFYTE